MGRAMATGAAIAAGPAGLRRLLGIAVVVGLLAVLAAVALVAMAGKTGSSGDGPLPCAPEEVTVRYSPGDTPEWAKEAVEEALEDAGRKPRTVSENGVRRDLTVVVWSTSAGAEPMLSGKTLRLERKSTAEEVEAALQEKLAPCEEGDGTAGEDTGNTEDTQDAPETRALGWNTPVAWIGGVLALWWAIGPLLVRLAGKGVRRRRGKADDEDDGDLVDSAPEPAQGVGHQK